MVTTSILDRAHSRFLLRLRDLDLEQTFDLNLYTGSATREELAIVDSAIVHSDHSYSVFLLANNEIASRDGLLEINCETEENVKLNPIYGLSEKEDQGEWHYYQLVFDKGKQSLFSMVFGLARIRLTIEEEPDPISLETFDLPCACDRDDYKGIVSGMLDELIDTEDRQCIDWMFHPVRFEREKASMVESALAEGSSRSLRPLVELARKTARTYKRHLDFFSLHGHCRTVGREALVSPSSVRRLGRCELLWLAQNPDQLYESNCETALCHNGKYYMAARIQTERHHKSFDNLENRSLVSFTIEICRILARAISDAEKHVSRFQRTRCNLEKANIEGDLLPTLVLIDTYLDRETPIIDEARRIQSQFKNIRERLLKSFPDVLEIQYVMPRRTKVFQEVNPYADIHAEMRDWNAFGDIDILRDTLALHTWRIDKLYEYFVLFKILQQLRDFGFSPRGEMSTAIKQIEYSIEDSDDVFRNDKQVANVYSLIRGDERVTLYYQPVFYGDEREEHGIKLHRTTAARIHPYWTPDYLIVHERDAEISNIVIDAKFRSRTFVHWGNAWRKGNESRSDLTNSAFLDCILKYRVATCGADGTKVDALWVLYGREVENKVRIYQHSKWAKANYGGIFDGIAPLSPEVNCIAEMMAKVGIDKEPSGWGAVRVKTRFVGSGIHDEKAASNLVASEKRTRVKGDSGRFDVALELVGQLDSVLYDSELLFDVRYAQRTLGLSHAVLKRRRASGYEAKLYSSQPVEIGDMSGYMYVNWRPNNLNRLRQLVRKAKR